MATTAAWNSAIKVGGTATTLTNAATTDGGAHTAYQVTTAANRVLDPNTAVVVQVDPDGVSGYATVVATTYTVEPLTGTITFASANGASALVRVSGKYIPLLTVAYGREFSLQEQAELEDVTVFGQQRRRRLLKLQDASGNIGMIEPLNLDQDPGAGTVKFQTLLEGGTPLFLEVRPGGAGQYWRAWVVFDSTEHTGSVDGILEAPMNFKAAPIVMTGRTDQANFGWSD